MFYAQMPSTNRYQPPVKYDLNMPEQLAMVVPSVFEQSLSEKVSEKYRIIPTIRVLEALWNEGWQVTKAVQTRSKQDTHAKHMIRLRHKSSVPVLNGTFSEIILTNSHDGTSAYILRAGIYRLVCLNGMTTGTNSFCERVRHSGNDVPRNVAAGADKILRLLPEIGERVIEMSQTEITPQNKKLFTIAAIDARMNEPLEPEEQQKQVTLAETRDTYRGFYLPNVERPRRPEDTGNSLWSAFQVLQEKMVKGGIVGGTARRRLVGIKSVDRDIDLNGKLWNIAEMIGGMQ